MPKFSNAEKAQELKRELGMRRHVYPRRVADGKMQQAASDRLIALTEDMLADYEKLAAADTPDLFGEAQELQREIRDEPPPARINRTYDERGAVVQESITNTIARGVTTAQAFRRAEGDMPRDPTFGKTPGVEIEREGQRFGTCKCGESTLTGQVRDVQTSTLNWRVFDAMPTEHNGFRYYTRHQCEHTRRRGG